MLNRSAPAAHHETPWRRMKNKYQRNFILFTHIYELNPVPFCPRKVQGGNMGASPKGVKGWFYGTAGVKQRLQQQLFMTKLTWRSCPACLARRKLVKCLLDRSNPCSWVLAHGWGEQASHRESSLLGKQGPRSGE